MLSREDERLWPAGDVALGVEYPPGYPQDDDDGDDDPELDGSSSLPVFTLIHDMNPLQFGTAAQRACLRSVGEAAEGERGMPCVMGCVMAATEFFLGGSFLLQGEGRDRDRDGSEAGAGSKRSKSTEEEGDGRGGDPPPLSLLLPPCDPDRTRECEEEGLEISEELLRRRRRRRSGWREGAAASADNNDIGSVGGGGGRWDYTIGLVGKPSAGKSTFFNAATAFARQRGGGGGGGGGKDGGGAKGNGDSTDGMDGVGDSGRTTPFFIGGASMGKP